MDMDMSPMTIFWVVNQSPTKTDNDENEHQLSLRMVSLGTGAKDELNVIEAGGMNYESSPIQ
jgi:hypothetical protein